MHFSQNDLGLKIDRTKERTYFRTISGHTKVFSNRLPIILIIQIHRYKDELFQQTKTS